MVCLEVSAYRARDSISRRAKQGAPENALEFLGGDFVLVFFVKKVESAFQCLFKKHKLRGLDVRYP